MGGEGLCFFMNQKLGGRFPPTPSAYLSPSPFSPFCPVSAHTDLPTRNPLSVEPPARVPAYS